MTLNDRMKLLSLGLFIALAGFASARGDTTSSTTDATSRSNKLSPPESLRPRVPQDTAIEIARTYVEKKYPDIDFSRGPATAESLAQGKGGWRMHLGGYPKINPATGQHFGRCGSYTISIFVNPDGTISKLWAGETICGW